MRALFLVFARALAWLLRVLPGVCAVVLTCNERKR